MKSDVSEALFERAVKVMPGGVNSPVRAFGPVGGSPRFISSAKGQYIYDEDGNRYIDYIGSWGPMILGHNDDRVVEAVIKQAEKGLSFGAATRLEVEMAELICDTVPCVEMIRMVNSGTEAVMSAVRAARGFTGRDKIIKFEGCYHGHADAMLVKAGSGVMTHGAPDSAGVPEGCAKDTLTAAYNDIQSVQALFSEYPEDIACVIIEPVAANMGLVVPKDGYLRKLRELCDKYGALLIFDEVITGFRLAMGGAAEYFGVTPDIVTYGKIIGGGMPVGAYGGRRDIMSVVSPLGSVYQAGTLSGNPAAMSAGLAQLRVLKENAEIYENINALGERFRNGLKRAAEKAGAAVTVNGIGSLSCLYFKDGGVCGYRDAKLSDAAAFAAYFNYMLGSGSYFGPSRFEAVFISNAHTEADIDKTIRDAEEFFTNEQRG